METMTFFNLHEKIAELQALKSRCYHNQIKQMLNIYSAETRIVIKKNDSFREFSHNHYNAIPKF